MNGVLIDVYAQQWKSFVSDLRGFPSHLIEQSQQIIKDTIDAVIHENISPPTEKGFFWGVEYFQQFKILLQNMMFQNRDSDNIRVWLAQAMQQVISGPADFQAAKVAILTLVSMNERAWSLAYFEGERDLMIEYCKVQLDEIRTAMFPSSELKFRLHSLFYDIHNDVAHHYRIINFNDVFQMLESVFAVELDIQLRYAILADQHGQLRWDLAEDRLRSREVSAGELRKAAGSPHPYLAPSLQDEIRKRKAELALMESELASMGARRISPRGTLNILQDQRV